MLTTFPLWYLLSMFMMRCDGRDERRRYALHVCSWCHWLTASCWFPPGPGSRGYPGYLSPASLSPSDWPGERQTGLWVADAIMTPSPANTTPPHQAAHMWWITGCNLERVGDKHWDYWVTLMTVIIGLGDIKDDIRSWHVPTHGAVSWHMQDHMSPGHNGPLCPDWHVLWGPNGATSMSDEMISCDGDSPLSRLWFVWVTSPSVTLTMGHIIRPRGGVGVTPGRVLTLEVSRGQRWPAELWAEDNCWWSVSCWDQDIEMLSLLQRDSINCYSRVRA